MRRSRPPFQDKDAGARRAAQASVARNKRLRHGQPAEPVPSPETTVTSAAPEPDETTSSGIQPGLREYNPPTPQQPPQPWSHQSDTPLPLRVSEEQEPPTAANGESPLAVPPSDKCQCGGKSEFHVISLIPHSPDEAAILSALTDVWG